MKRTSLVIGGSGKIGGYIVKHLSDERPYAMSREARSSPGAVWIKDDLQTITQIPPVHTIYCTANAILLADALPRIISPALKRVVVFTTTSILTKMESGTGKETSLYRQFADAEYAIRFACDRNGVGWTILRPTLVYDEGRDGNITRISRMIRRFGFMPLSGSAEGLRQPVHAEDLAIGAIAAASSQAARNKVYALPGGETISYREMIGRVFDGLSRKRRMVSVSPSIWRAAFTAVRPFYPGFNAAMGDRMSQHMTFDSSPAAADFGWAPRKFHPKF